MTQTHPDCHLTAAPSPPCNMVVFGVLSKSCHSLRLARSPHCRCNPRGTLYGCGGWLCGCTVKPQRAHTHTQAKWRRQTARVCMGRGLRTLRSAPVKQDKPKQLDVNNNGRGPKESRKGPKMGSGEIIQGHNICPGRQRHAQPRGTYRDYK